jgi:hypothetical protein
VVATEKARVDQRFQQRLTRSPLESPQALRLVARERQSRHLEKFCTSPPNELFVDPILLSHGSLSVVARITPIEGEPQASDSGHYAANAPPTYGKRTTRTFQNATSLQNERRAMR